MSRWRRFLRAPALHFVVLGGLLFAADGSRSRRDTPDPLPSAGRKVGERLSDEEILFREAVALGLDRTDPFVRERLVRLARFVETGGVEDAARLERDARRLGLDRRDLVVRRHLVQAMELALGRGGAHEWPSDTDLAAYLEAHRDRFVEPARVRFSHVFFARDRAGDAPDVAAAAALARLQADDGTGVDPAVLGDGFLAGLDIATSEPEVARTFGPEFATAVARLPIGRWAGPVRSSYGVHLVRVSERTAATVPPLAVLRRRLVQAVRADQAAARLVQRLSERRVQYEGRGSS